ncbi:all-trans-retinol 13,14-reductase [Aureococcus anophagefferens]|nr:all-trans-retinol 13,14-reductase [Aureococcus anophagefferens]
MLLELSIALLTLLVVLRRRLHARWAKLPSWKDLDSATLKVGGSAKKLEAYKDVDVVVIGSGVGGLACASILAKGGYKVVVLEQHDVIGGSTHTFEDKGYEFDVGLHYVGGDLESFFSPVRRVWAAVTDGKLEWTHCDATYDVARNTTTGLAVEWTEDVRRNDATVLPRACLRLSWPLLGPVWRRFGVRSVADTAAACGMAGDLADLGGCVTYLYGDYGVNPARAPWFVHALVATHCHGGSFFPTGGCSSIAKTLVAAIARRGGAAFCRAPVDSILVEGGRAVGVRCRGATIRAAYVISCAGFRNTFGCEDLDDARTTRRGALLPRSVAEPQRALLQGDAAKDRVGGSIAMVYLFVGLDASDEALGIRSQNVWAVKDWRHDAAHAHLRNLDLAEGDVPELTDLPGVFVGSASAKDADYQRRHPGKASMVVLTIVRPEWFDAYADSTIKHRGAAYDAFKAKWRDLLLEALYAHWPATRGHVAYTDVGTPLSNDFYLGSVRGEVYALENTADRAAASAPRAAPASAVPASCSRARACCVGVVSALVSGLLTAANVSYVAALRCVLEIVLAV